MATKQSKAKTNKETPLRSEFSVSADQIVNTVKKLVKEGNARSISIKNESGKTLITIPLTVGVVGAALLPVWAAVGAIAALVTKCTIVVKKKSSKET